MGWWRLEMKCGHVANPQLGIVVGEEIDGCPVCEKVTAEGE